jgi:hypothetical protein
MRRRSWEFQERRFERCSMGDPMCESMQRRGQPASCVDCRIDAGTLPQASKPRPAPGVC